ncbi:MAG TPA: pyroglutamyl-peptidase I [Candidatus Binatia bacterium]|nr:pyroglutamyl-peptidase I [Candidatus Binatia bacterium]
MSTILLTGFEPYGDTPINPAEQVARSLDGVEVEGARVVSRIVPNTFFKSIDVVTAAIRELRPDSVVMMGEFSGRAMVTVERIAQNLNDGARYGLRDNDGNALRGQMTVPGGPAAYYSTLPIRAMVSAMRQAGVPADISDAPGTFCCNHLMYGTLHYLATEQLAIRAGWVHLPALPAVAARVENVGMPSMSTETSAAGVRAALAAIQLHPVDVDETVRSRLQV